MLGKIRSKSADSRKSGISRSDSQKFIEETFGEARGGFRSQQFRGGDGRGG